MGGTFIAAAIGETGEVHNDEFTGTRPEFLSGKDIFLHIAGTYGDATNHNLEYGGPAMASVPMNEIGRAHV